MKDFSESAQQFLNSAADGFSGVNQWFYPLPNLLRWIVFRRICWQEKDFNIRMFFDKSADCLGSMHRGVVKNQSQCFISGVSAQLMQERFKNSGVTFS